MNIYIGKNIKRLRIEKGLTQEELAGFLGVSFQAVSKWERGIAYPDVEMIPVIANYFDITISIGWNSCVIPAVQRTKCTKRPGGTCRGSDRTAFTTVSVRTNASVSR